MRASGQISSRCRVTLSRMFAILQHVPFVMKAGVVYKNEAQPATVDKLVATDTRRMSRRSEWTASR